MSVVRISTANTMGVRRLMAGAQRSFRSSRPHLVGYHVTRGLGDTGDINAANSFQAGTPLDPSMESPDLGVYSVGTLPSGDAGYSLTSYMPGVTYSPQPAAPSAVTGAQSAGGAGVPQTPLSFVPPQPAMPAGSATGTPQSAAGSSGGTFPLWLGIAVLIGAAIILPPLIKKL